jgi:hypothetical protein
VPYFAQALPSSTINGEHRRTPSLLSSGSTPHPSSLVRGYRSTSRFTTDRRSLSIVWKAAVEACLRHLTVTPSHGEPPPPRTCPVPPSRLPHDLRQNLTTDRYSAGGAHAPWWPRPRLHPRHVPARPVVLLGQAVPVKHGVEIELTLFLPLSFF